MAHHQQTSIAEIKGIGPETEKTLHELGIYDISDLLNYFPYRYDDYELRDLEEVKHEERVTVEGKVHSEPSLTYYGKKRNRLTFRVLVGNYLITAVCFNRPYLKKKLTLGSVVTISGKWDKHRQTVSVQELKNGPHQEDKSIEPVYSVKENVTVKMMRRFIKEALQHHLDSAADPLPEKLRIRYKLPDYKHALQTMHQPETRESLQQARRRFVYEEFLLFQLKMQAFRKAEREQSKGISHVFPAEKLAAFTDSLPFSLTTAQTRVLREITADMTSPYRMNRLLQGDVGSGKTAVAAIALYAAILSGYQGALMVPTEILAEQHADSLVSLFANEDVNIALLTSSVKGKRRRELLERLALGEIDILVGTHALIQDEVEFKALSLVITDEQHRFGVEQRKKLKNKGQDPDVLFMTATPIPRTLAITVFGEMDVSVIDEMPAGRKQIETYWVKHDMLERILAFIEKELKQGRQAYIICPLIEESDKLDVQNAIDVYNMLSDVYRGKWNVGLMHGKLHSDEKDQVMREFSANQCQVLVSTTVVEVGVNVPNATIMVIYDADRFGLSQLHQLRGRVGRGDHQSFCILMADPKSETGKERMRIMSETNDGFELSEKDLELRGPGDFFGKKQSGMPEFKVADMVHDYRALETARQDAANLLSSEAFWKDDEYRMLRGQLLSSGVLEGEKLS
ncbi:ATP-dependent DNA helicase RecG [Bacillus velezensis]|uniref:ATP-dependent DNA helicase RecG n=1 Tax=Bacillus TaxID=1386 RepID=UPI00026B9E7A|nr:MULTISPECIES: ATP-dependent DNA helicase RecG [Bacillus]AIW29805.1 ATP-dependent DNA helicase [Bacillus subtilis]MBU8884484.1 ATP-dependent DNA helicase RecG [Bacillus sp. FJAT-27001]AZG38953.1 ATP-dependent DNA helicase RecG [Bacillus velezensis]EJD66629.1 ATP-dependent DNA helicase RecG [Bacillus sp. 916]CDG29514.1 branch migrating ATP-dependent DNA helicase involved in DNA recombination and repair [Bacillus velezensis UCMB5033]